MRPLIGSAYPGNRSHATVVGMKHKQSIKKVAKVAIALFLLWLVLCLLPTIGQGLKTTRLHSVFVDEHAALTSYVDALVGKSEDRISAQCYPEDQGYWQTSADCSELVVYGYNSATPPTTITVLEQTAHALDLQLKKEGWTIDRPQDPYKTLEAGAAYVYDKQLTPFVGVEVPYHKNIGPISCNLRIWFEGSRSDSRVPVANVNDFRCSQGVTYFAPRLHKAHHTII